ncbi:MAG: glycoside hydrolase family 32 protein [bacterium]
MMKINSFRFIFYISLLSFLFSSPGKLKAQSWELTPDNINTAIKDSAININKDTLRPAFHLTPPVGSMGDPNGGIYHNGWYHIFYGLQPFAFHPGAWYWAHARSRDLLHWEHMKTGLTPAFELGLNAIGSGSTIITGEGEKLAFYSQSKGGPMLFWRAEFTNDDLTEWKHEGDNPILTLNHPGLPPYDDFWRDPFVFEIEGRTFLIACADLFEEDYVPVPIFEARDDALTDWEYKGNLFTVPKHKYRNLEVPEFRPLGDKWIFMASTDAPVDRVNYFIGEFDLENLKFIPEYEAPVDYSGHYYAQETIQDDDGNLFLMSWMPGWDRDWLPTYMNEPLKNSNPLWNGCFALPRKLSIRNGELIQQPVETLKELRSEHFELESMELPVIGPMTAYHMVEEFRGDQLEINAEFDLHNASFCGMNVLSDSEGEGGLFIVWSGNMLNVDGVKVPIKEWKPGERLELQVYVDQNLVEVFVNGGKYCISRLVRRENTGGQHIALSSLGGTAKLVSFEGWLLESISNISSVE